MKFFAQLKTGALAIAGAALAVPAVAEITWKESYYNPAPAEGDLILPMPCGGAMTFRPVETPNAEGSVGDVRVTLGAQGGDAAYLNGLRRSYVSGGFPVGGDVPKGLFWIGKYEIAQAQWNAVMDDECPAKAPRKRGFVPQVERSHLDMARFAERYTLWLLRDAPGTLPEVGETRAYLRLPTEDEWEFAARGGLAVQSAAFRAPRPPLEQGTEPSEYIAHGGTDSAGGKLQVIGTLKPNPLGLHDMLGNAAEIVETPFALIRHGRRHGQAGGVVKRGGDARTPLIDITSATRFEVPPIDLRTSAPMADRFTGARLAIGALAITSAEQLDQLNADLDRLARADENLTSAATEKDIASVLDALDSSLINPSDRQLLGVVRANIDAARAERNAQRNRSIRLIIDSGTLICDTGIQRLLNALAMVSMLPGFDEAEAEARAAQDEAYLAEVEAARAEYREALIKLESQASAKAAEMTNLIEGLSDDFALPLLTRQIAFVQPDIDAAGPRRAACLDLLSDMLGARAVNGFLDVELVKKGMSGIAKKLADTDI